MAEREMRSAPRMSDLEALMWNLDKDPHLTSVFANVTVLDCPPDREHLRRKLGRAVADIPRLRAGYDAGRAAYFAKFMSFPQSRKSYLIGFILRPIGRTLGEQFVSSRRIAVSGTRYLRHSRKPSMIPLLGLAIVLQASASLFRFARSGFRHVFG